MQNPFVYGEVVPAKAFVNRVLELDRLVNDLASSQKIFLISPRRYGKSSLIRHALAAMGRRGALTVDVTVSSFSSYVAFLEGYARALVSAETRWDRARTWLRDVVRTAKAEVRYAPDPTLATPGAGSLSVSFPGVRSDRDVSRLAQEVFTLPARLAAERRKQVVVALDEFQAIGGFNGGSVEHALRAAVQTPARGRLRVRRIGAEPDGADADAETPLLQGGPGDAAREDPGRRIRRVHRRAVHASQASSRSRASGCRSSSWPATSPTTCSGSHTRHGTKCDRPGAAAPRSTTCTRHSAVSSPNSRRCSRPCGSG